MAPRGTEALARLAAQRVPIGNIHDAHLLLASTTDGFTAAIEHIRATLRDSGAIFSPDTEDQDFFPGVVLSALGSHHALSEKECTRSLDHYRQRFRNRPSWPAVWWHLRAWSIIARFVPHIARDFVFELADWAIAHQLPSGAFDTWCWPVAPSFHTACVVEGLLEAVSTARQFDDRSRACRYLSAASRGLQFSSSLVLDGRNTHLFACSSRAIGGVRAWHGELLLRADVAGHYLAAVTRLAELTEDE